MPVDLAFLYSSPSSLAGVLLLPLFTEPVSLPGQTVDKWIESVEFSFSLRHVPENIRFPFAFKHLSNPIQETVMSLTGPLGKISGRTWEWDWARLKVALRGVEKQKMRSESEKAGGRWVKMVAFGALVGAAGPLALGLGLTATAICAVGGSIAALNKPDSADIMATMRTSVIAADVGDSRPSPEASETIRQIRAKDPSKGWKDGLNFNPSMELIADLIGMLVPQKNMR